MSETTAVSIAVRVKPALRDEIEDWRRSKPSIPPRSVAMRQLIEQALRDERRQKSPTKAA